MCCNKPKILRVVKPQESIRTQQKVVMIRNLKTNQTSMADKIDKHRL